MTTATCSNPSCLAEFSVKPKTKGLYCSRSCAVTVNNTKHPKRKTERPMCPCGTEVVNKGASKYCSIEHSVHYRRMAQIQPWLDGEWDGSTSSGALSAAVRNWLLEQAEWACSRCKWSEVNPLVKSGKPTLTIDHIDGNWKNNKVDNLVVLCYNCHTLTPTFNALNKGNPLMNGGRQYNHRMRD